ncbi:unnamed protein product, partial [Discosporangium mesarthrocarpum]
MRWNYLSKMRVHMRYKRKKKKDDNSKKEKALRCPDQSSALPRTCTLKPGCIAKFSPPTPGHAVPQVTPRADPWYTLPGLGTSLAECGPCDENRVCRGPNGTRS